LCSGSFQTNYVGAVQTEQFQQEYFSDGAFLKIICSTKIIYFTERKYSGISYFKRAEISSTPELAVEIACMLKSSPDSGKPLLRIRDVYPESEFFPSRIRIKEFK
jgi:hypothetical protein